MNEPHNIIAVGIDWADAEHAFHLDDGHGNVLAGVMQQTPEDIERVIKQWSQRFPNATFALAIEASKGALINALQRFDNLEIYPINPAALSNYRKAFAPGGGKNDPADAQLLCDYLQHYRAKLRPLKRNDPLTEELVALGEDRRRFVDQRTRLANELTALLKRYFPAVLALKPAKSYAEFPQIPYKIPQPGCRSEGWCHPPAKVLSRHRNETKRGRTN